MAVLCSEKCECVNCANNVNTPSLSLRRQLRSAELRCAVDFRIQKRMHLDVDTAIMCLLLENLKKLFAWGEGDSGGHVLRETTSRGLCGLVCPSRTSERKGEGDCVKEGGAFERNPFKCNRR
jgi:hypothetical protein